MNNYRPRTQSELNRDALKIFLFWGFVCTCVGGFTGGPVGAAIGFVIGMWIAYQIAP